jgi:hypothetical protein
VSLFKALKLVLLKSSGAADRHLAALCAILLLVMQVHALVTSNYISPTHHEFAQVLWVVAIIVALELRNKLGITSS